MQAATTLISTIENTGIPVFVVKRAAAIAFLRLVVESIIGARSMLIPYGVYGNQLVQLIGLLLGSQSGAKLY